MRRLSGTDTVLLLTESDTCPQHTLKVAIVDPTDAIGPLTFDAFRLQMRAAVARLEPLRWRLVRAPFDLGHPSWIETPVEDLDAHLHQLTLPEPGGRRELCAAVSTITERPLTPDRPLWEVWFVDGLESGRVAYFAKVHHALADGVSSGELLATAFTTDTSAAIALDELPVHEVEPDLRDQWHTVGRELAGMARRLPGLLAHTIGAARRARQFRRTVGRDTHAKPFSGPHTVFDAPLTPRRAFAYEAFDLASVKTISRATGATVTEVILAMVGGALRQYVGANGALPAETLTAAIPVSVRRPDEQFTWGNRIASWYLPLGTDVADPLARLHEITAHAHDAREELAISDPELQHSWAEYWRLFSVVTLGLPRLVRRVTGRPSYNAIVSSVRASDRPLARDGMRLAQLVSVGPLVEGIGVNFTAWSYAGELTVAILACPDHVEDIWELATALRASFEDLARAATATDTGS
ncbi:MAG: wax ester/triacylglycerol synthase family O-acyltransferase [Acidimicrobiia bacterium]